MSPASLKGVTLPRFRISPSCAVGILFLASIGCGSLPSFDPQNHVSVSSTANPLVAQYTIKRLKSGAAAWVEFGGDTNYGRQTSPVTDSASTSPFVNLNVLVAGMLPQTTYHMRAHVNGSSGDEWVDEDRTFTTGALSAGVVPPGLTVTRPAPGSSPAPGVELLSLIPNTTTSQTMQAVVADLNGNVIWYCPQAAIPPRPLPNGHFLFQESVLIEEVDLACNSIRSVSLDQVNQSLQTQAYTFGPISVFHHDAIALPNGHWIALGQITKDYTDLVGYPGTTAVVGDVLVDIDLNGNVAWAWSAFDYLDINRHLEGLPDWTHSNAIVYTEDGNLLLSMRHQSWVLKIDYQNGAGAGDILWRLGQDGDFVLASGDPAQWFYGQHYPNILSVNGKQTTLAVYDDGNYRIDSTGTACDPTVAPPTCYSRATIFQIDESTDQASLVWDYAPGFFSLWGGSIAVLSNGDVEFDSSDPVNLGISEIIEVTHTDSPQIVWTMSFQGQPAYRGFRLPSLYPGVTWQK
jgi:arylsulfate sulfotransferase